MSTHNVSPPRSEPGSTGPNFAITQRHCRLLHSLDSYKCLPTKLLQICPAQAFSRIFKQDYLFFFNPIPLQVTAGKIPSKVSEKTHSSMPCSRISSQSRPVSFKSDPPRPLKVPDTFDSFSDRLFQASLVKTPSRQSRLETSSSKHMCPNTSIRSESISMLMD